MSIRLDKAFVLAAGLGTRMRPLTDRMPKPLVQVAGRALIDHVLDRIAAAGISDTVVNVHYLADQIELHLRERGTPRIMISDERSRLLDTGGGIAHALPLLGHAPFLVHNSDSIWIETGLSNLARLASTFETTHMDALLLLADRETSVGYRGRGDFHLESDGRLRRPERGETAAYVFAGASIAGPGLLRDMPAAPFSLNRLWDRSMAAGRLYGLPLDGTWMHVGDPEAVAAAEALMRRGEDGGRSTA